MGLLDWLRGSQQDSRIVDTGSTAPLGRVPSFAVIDVETTGLSPKRDRILELAIVRLDSFGEVVDEWSTRINPEGPVGATHIHGIRDQDVIGAPLFREVAPTIALGLSGLPVVAHNAPFDTAFLRSEFHSAGWDLPLLASYCTLDASHHHLPHIERRGLADCCAATGINLQNAHSALGDARATALLLRSYIARFRAPDQALAAAQIAARQARWPEGPAREHARPSGGRAVASSTRQAIRYSAPKPKQPLLRHQIDAMSLRELLDEGAPAGVDAYLELLLSALEDGEISDDEAAAFQDIRESYGLNDNQVQAAHEAFILALAHRAVLDGRISNAEKAELSSMSDLLGVPTSRLKDVLQNAEGARSALLSSGLSGLPEGWRHGEPLRVGDKVAFTGCDDSQRDRLERAAEQVGVRVMNNVSKFTVLLVADGSFEGSKFGKAREFSTRIVHPDVFEVLLRHVQPAVVAEKVIKPSQPSIAAPPR